MRTVTLMLAAVAVTVGLSAAVAFAATIEGAQPLSPLRWRLTLFIALPMWMILPDDNVWRKALKIGQDVYGKAVFAGDNDYYVVALPVDPPNSPNQVIDEARVVESLKSYDEAAPR